MDRRHFVQQIVGSGLLLGSYTSLFAAEPVPGKPGSKIKWQPNLKTAHKTAVDLDKPLMIVFGATWCAPCRRLESETLTDKRTIALIDREFIPLHLDYDKEAKIVEILEVERIPCLVILTPDANLLHRSEGFATPKEFQAKLNAALAKRTDIKQVRATDSGR